MSRLLHLLVLSLLVNCLLAGSAHSQVTLGSSPYTENFDNIGSGLPSGFTIKTGATAATIGTDASLITAMTSWSNSSGAFKNFASATGLTSISTSADQNNSTNRALGVRQTGAFGDAGAAFVFQVTNTTGKTNFKLNFLLQSLDPGSPRTATWKVEYAIGNEPYNFISPASVTGDLTTGGSSFKNNAVGVDFSNALDNQAQVITIRIVSLTATTGSGNRPSSAVDDFTLSWNEGTSATPVIILNNNGNTALNFGATTINTISGSQTYTVRGSDLTAPVSISTTSPYMVSADNTTFATSLEIQPSDAASDKTVYVRFAPTASGMFPGTITNSSAGATSKNITLTGEGIRPGNLNFNFDNCLAAGQPASGFISYNVTGAQQWACSAFGRNSTNGVDINGYSGSALDNEDWLVSPALLISTLNLPVLSFYSRGEFTGPSLQLLISTDYDGGGNPGNATWTNLNANFPPLTNVWTLTDGINLSAYKSFPKIYIAFKYVSSPDLGAARWTLDDVSVTDRSRLLSFSPAALNFGEVPAGNSSAAQPFTFQSIGYGNVTLASPAGYQLSADNISFANSVSFDANTAQNGATVYARLSPSGKFLKIEGRIRFTGNGLDSASVLLTGSSYPKAETFDAGAYNLSFFGSNSSNTPTPEKITTQINNIAAVFQHLNLDVVGIEEVSNDSALAVMVSKLPGYASIISNRWSYSFNPPDPGFPPQKTGFIYNTSTMHVVEQRVLFEHLYDSVRNGLDSLPGYPDSSSHFWSSGRLPFMVTFDATVGGVTKRVRMIDIHAKSASDPTSYQRRVYDVKVLKDSLDTYYNNDNIILLGDYNDRVKGSINAGAVSPYKIFVDDNLNYKVLTYPLDSAGRVSFISGTGMIDHITISNELENNNIDSSTDIEDPRTYISNYNATTASDHLPVFTRFNLSSSASLPVALTQFDAQQKGTGVLITWVTSAEYKNSYFIVEKSPDGKNFTAIAKVNGQGNRNGVTDYESTDSFPFAGVNYYRLQQVDIDGKVNLSNTIRVNFKINDIVSLSVYPNPAKDHIRINLNSSASDYVATVARADGSTVLRVAGDIVQVNHQVNRNFGKLAKGLYILQIQNSSHRYTVKLIKQ